jgi:hypothetical protein
MSDLQLGLLVIGVAAVVAVLVYNRLQERKAVREAQRAFASQNPDVLLGASREDPAQASTRPLPRRMEVPAGGLPDPRVDYVIELEVGRGTLPSTVLEHWRSLEHRFAQRALLAGSDGESWQPVVPGEVRSLTALRAALQLVSRGGVTGDAELLEFRSGAETLGAALGARISAPQMREALEAARELDGVCAEADIQVALHVVGGDTQQAIEPGEHPFHMEPRADGVSLVLDVPRTAEPARAFEAMARSGHALAAARGARLVDDNGNLLDARALAAIAAELESVRTRLAAAGVEPGSDLALRLFS